MAILLLTEWLVVSTWQSMMSSVVQEFANFMASAILPLSYKEFLKRH
jgi:hypothetical protein